MKVMLGYVSHISLRQIKYNQQFVSCTGW